MGRKTNEAAEPFCNGSHGVAGQGGYHLLAQLDGVSDIINLGHLLLFATNACSAVDNVIVVAYKRLVKILVELSLTSLLMPIGSCFATMIAILSKMLFCCPQDLVCSKIGLQHCCCFPLDDVGKDKLKFIFYDNNYYYSIFSGKYYDHLALIFLASKEWRESGEWCRLYMMTSIQIMGQ